MPKIIPYESQVNFHGPSSGRRASGSDLGAGEAIQQFGTTVFNTVYKLGEAQYKRDVANEISDVNTFFSEQRAASTINLKDQADAAVPGDQEFADRFVSRLNEGLSEIPGRYKTKEARQRFKDLQTQLSGDMLVRATEHQVKLAADKRISDMQVQSQSWLTTLLSDPTQYETILSIATASIMGMPDVDVATKQKILIDTKYDIATYAVKGLIEVNAPAALRQLKDGEWDDELLAKDKDALIGEAQTRISQIEVEGRAAAAELRRQKAEEQLETGNDFVNRLPGAQLQPGQTYLTVAEIRASNLDPTGDNSKKMYIDWIDRINKEGKLETDPIVAMALFRRIHSDPRTNPNAIIDENDLNQYFGNGLDQASFNFLRGEVQQLRTAEGKQTAEQRKQLIRIAQGALSGANELTGQRDPIGEQLVLQYIVELQRIEKEYVEKGGNITDLYDKNNKAYMGGAAIDKYRRTQTEQLRDMMIYMLPKNAEEGLSGEPIQPVPVETPKEVPQRRPGETPDEFLKRINK